MPVEDRKATLKGEAGPPQFAWSGTPGAEGPAGTQQSKGLGAREVRPLLVRGPSSPGDPREGRVPHGQAAEL